MGVSGGVWECGKPERFSIISMPQMWVDAEDSLELW